MGLSDDQRAQPSAFIAQHMRFSAVCPSQRGDDRIGLDLAGPDLAGERPDRTGDLVAAAIVEGDHQPEAAVAGGHGLGFREKVRDVAGDAVATADDAHPHTLRVEGAEVAVVSNGGLTPGGAMLLTADR